MVTSHYYLVWAKRKPINVKALECPNRIVQASASEGRFIAHVHDDGVVLGRSCDAGIAQWNPDVTGAEKARHMCPSYLSDC